MYQYRSYLNQRLSNFWFYIFIKYVDLTRTNCQKNVPMNETRSSTATTTIGTDYLGRCLTLLMEFKHIGKDAVVLIHYSFNHLKFCNISSLKSNVVFESINLSPIICRWARFNQQPQVQQNGIVNSLKRGNGLRRKTVKVNAVIRRFIVV